MTEQKRFQTEAEERVYNEAYDWADSFSDWYGCDGAKRERLTDAFHKAMLAAKALPAPAVPAADPYEQGRRDVLNAILALNPEIEVKLAALHEREPDPDGRLPLDVVVWVCAVAEQLGIEPKGQPA